MRFLILGASGFLGRHLRRLLVARGYAVIGTQSRSQDPNLLRFDLAKDRILDCVPSSFLTANGRLHVVHATGFGGPDSCARNVDSSRFVNVVAIRRLVEDLAPFAPRHILLSSSYVFDGRTGGYREDDPCQVICEYGRQKVELEKFLLAEHPESCIARLDKVVGDDPRERHLFSDWLGQLQRGEPVLCWSGQTMSPILVDDVGRAIVAVCQRPLTGLIHLSGVEVLERMELARRFQQAMGLPGTIATASEESFHFADPRPVRCHLDGRAFRESTGFQPTSLPKILHDFSRAVLGTDS